MAAFEDNFYLTARLVFIAQYHATSWVFRIPNWQVLFNVIYWVLSIWARENCKTKPKESFRLNWPWLVAVFPANQLPRVNYRRKIHSCLSLCEQHPLKLCGAQPEIDTEAMSFYLPHGNFFTITTALQIYLILLARSPVVRALPMTTMSFYN